MKCTSIRLVLETCDLRAVLEWPYSNFQVHHRSPSYETSLHATDGLENASELQVITGPMLILHTASALH
eukprot:752585-Hanusia_phi.AAC.1